MKIIGIVLIAISVVAYGYLKTSACKKRPDSLAFFIKLISKYKSDLIWQQKSFCEVLDDYKTEQLHDYLETAKALTSSNSLIDSFFVKNTYFPALHLKTEDLTVLKNFFASTGKYGIEEETDLCEKTLIFLDSQKSKADSECEKQGKLYFKLTVLFAIWIIILLI